MKNITSALVALAVVFGTSAAMAAPAPAKKAQEPKKVEKVTTKTETKTVSKHHTAKTASAAPKTTEKEVSVKQTQVKTTAHK